MKHRYILTVAFFLCMTALFFLFPTKGLAVDYSISKANIEAYLLEDGTVNVHETFTYKFAGDFNGITRELIPKKGAKITNIHAKEGSTPLKTKKEGNLYKIYRKGSNETITIDIIYNIKNGINVYSDVADFYWPFFDERNESTYENLTISVHPPKETDEVIAYGEDKAFDTEKIQKGGTVVFNLGKVPSEENGNIRVAYNAQFFPQAPLSSNTAMKDKIIQAKQQLITNEQERRKTQKSIYHIANVVNFVFALILTSVLLFVLLKEKMRRNAIKQEFPERFFVPKQIMSLPATILYTNGNQLQSNHYAASFLDLLRKGYIQKTEENYFILNHQKGLTHENIFMDFLFHKVGENGQFSFDMLSDYMKNAKNHDQYFSFQQQWIKAVKEEMKQQDLYESPKLFRLFIGIFTALLLSLLVLLLNYDLLGSFFVTLLLFCAGCLFIIMYRPKTWKGLKIYLEWNEMKKQINELTGEQWNNLTEDEMLRTYIYGTGINEPLFEKKQKNLIQSFKLPFQSYEDPFNAYSTIYSLGPITSYYFYHANETAASSLDSNYSSGHDSGGGIGGGGGGSGAF